jgi:hypothetical protein
MWQWATVGGKVSGGASDQTRFRPCSSLVFVVPPHPRLARQHRELVWPSACSRLVSCMLQYLIDMKIFDLAPKQLLIVLLRPAELTHPGQNFPAAESW